MVDIEKYNITLHRYLHKHKEQKLGFEDGCVNGYITKIELDERKNTIALYGVVGLDDNERLLMTIDEDMKNGKDFKYNNKYHIFQKL